MRRLRVLQDLRRGPGPRVPPPPGPPFPRTPRRAPPPAGQGAGGRAFRGENPCAPRVARGQGGGGRAGPPPGGLARGAPPATPPAGSHAILLRPLARGPRR